MSTTVTRVLAAGAMLMAAAPAYAGGGKGSHTHGSYYSTSYYHNHHHGYRYYGVWPYGYYGYYDYDAPTVVVPDTIVTGPVAPASYPSQDPPPAPEPLPPPAPPPVPVPTASSPAVVRIHTAAAAKMWVDGTAVNQTGEVRTFTTPPLDGGKAYSYGIRACWLEDGRPVVRSRTISVAAGKTTDVDLR